MSIPFALSLSKYVNSTGTDVGFASLLGVALLALLYFAGARESRTLRDQLEEAHERITALEARLAQSLRNQAARAAAGAVAPGQVPQIPGRPGVVPAPSVAAMGTAVARVQREIAAAAAPAVLVGAAVSSAAPALGSATKLIPTSVPEPVAVPVSATVAGAAATAGATMYNDDEEFEDEFGPEDTMFVPASRTAAAANGRSGGGGAAIAEPPRVQLYDDAGDDDGPVPRRTIPTVDTGPSRSRVFLVRLGGTAAAILVVAVIVVALLLITNSGSTQHKIARVPTTTRTQPKQKKAAAFNPAKVKVSVLNGTAFTGLAGDIGKQLSSEGYRVPPAAVTNDSGVETLASTVVNYRPGYQQAALHIADALHKADGIVIPQTRAATTAEITSCGTPVATGDVGTCPANVIVTVGDDLSSAANSSASN